MSDEASASAGTGAGSRALGLVLTGGGARAAYQVGLLRCLARHAPELRIPIITGFSAGAINATFLAAHPGSLTEAADALTRLWTELNTDQVFHAGTLPLMKNAMRWGLRLGTGGSSGVSRPRGLVDTSPLREYLRKGLGTVDGMCHGISDNLETHRLQAVALSTLKYSTGQTVTWVEGSKMRPWARPDRIGRETRISVDHIMASAALPLVFPAVRIGGSWYGDGGVRLAAPLAPAIHLGAERLLAISTRYARDQKEASTPAISGYPPTAQVVGTLLNAIFLDTIDHDAGRLEQVNRLLAKLPPEQWEGLKPLEILVLRPSRDLGRLAADFEPKLPRTFRFLTRGLGTRETSSPDFLSMLMFQTDYLQRLIELGEEDAESRLDELKRLLAAT
jgi:NTE family protein